MRRTESALAEVIPFPDSIAEANNGTLVCVVSNFRANLYEIVSPDTLAELDVDFAEGFSLDDLTIPTTSDSQRRLILVENTRVDFDRMANQSVIDLMIRGTERGVQTAAYACGRNLLHPIVEAWRAAQERYMVRGVYHAPVTQAQVTRTFQDIAEAKAHFSQTTGWTSSNTEGPFEKFWEKSREKY